MSDSHILAHRDGLPLILNILMRMGAMCPECGFGTRVVDRRWMRCTKCKKKFRRPEKAKRPIDG